MPAPGTRLGVYEILSRLGEGGMGEVFRARDTKLGREVAIKVLPAEFAQDPARLVRFEREARTLAALNHPNIAHVYGFERAALPDGSPAHFLAMEMVDGEDLAERLTGGAIPVDEAITIARQIAEGLEEAHEKGIIHRDLKPANVKLTPDGKVKVLDFGLAKAIDGENNTTSDPSHSPTMSRHATEAGLILGTAAYMSPEQARGKAVDKRADIWAFGVVLFEMLSGARLFTGETVSDILAGVLKNEVSLKALPPSTPSHVVALLERCLARDPKARLRDIGEARLSLTDARSDRPRGEERTRPPTAAPGARRWVWATVAAAAVGGIVLGALVGRALIKTPAASGPEVRLSILPPPSGFRGAVDPAVSPDGRVIAFVAPGASGTPQLWVRALDSTEARPLADTEAARLPFWSPDGKWIGFFAAGKLRKVPVDGGVPEVLADAASGRGATWNQRGDILFTPASFLPIHRTTAAGVPARPLVLRGEAAGPITERRSDPWFLPDGRRYLFSRGSTIAVGDLESPEVKEILPIPSKAAYARGHLYFVRDGNLYAQPFTPNTLALGGEAVKIADRIGWSGDTPTGFSFSVAPTGLVVYADRSATPSTQLTWVDRTGRVLSTLGEPGEHLGLALSPDGERVAVEMHEPGGGVVSVWLVDGRTGTRSRFTDSTNWTGTPLWSADSRRLLATGFTDVWDIHPIGGGQAREIPVGAGIKWPSSWSPTGRYVLFTESGEGFDLGLVDLDASPPAKSSYLRTQFEEVEPRISPDGRWVAYESTESGTREVYVQSFPVPGAKVRVSTSGGGKPLWRPDGRAVFFRGSDGGLFETDLTFGSGAVGVATAATRRLFTVPGELFATGHRRNYDVSADGQRFLFNLVVPDPLPRGLTVIMGGSSFAPSVLNVDHYY